MKALHERKVAEMVKSLHEEMVDFDSLLGTGLEDAHEGSDVSTDEEFTKLRLHLNRVKAEVEDITKLKASLQAAVESSNSKILSVESELSSCHFTISQQETKLQALTTSLEEAEERKRQLEETADQLNVQMYQLDVQDKLREASHRDKSKHQEGLLQSANDMKLALEEELESHREAHRRQISTLRSDIAKLEKTTNELKDELQTKDLAYESVKAGYEKQRMELQLQSCQLEKLQAQNSVREKARKELKAVEETVAKELLSLQRVRQDLMEEIKSRSKVGTNTEPETLEAQKIAFLESNLDQLTQAHKQLVKNNSELQCQLPKLERQLAAKRDRISQLEASIRDFKANAHKEKQRLATELEHLKSAYEVRMKRGRLPSQATIVKAVRPGQHVTPSNFSTGSSPWQPFSGTSGYVPNSRVNPFAASALNFTVSPAPDAALVSAKPFAAVSKPSDVPGRSSSSVDKVVASESQSGIQRSKNKTTGDSSKGRSKSNRRRQVPAIESHHNRQLPVIPNHVTGGGHQAGSVGKRTGFFSATDAVYVVDTAERSDLSSEGVLLM
jgi:chromosome segregation ATPase